MTPTRSRAAKRPLIHGKRSRPTCSETSVPPCDGKSQKDFPSVGTSMAHEPASTPIRASWMLGGQRASRKLPSRSRLNPGGGTSPCWLAAWRSWPSRQPFFEAPSSTRPTRWPKRPVQGSSSGRFGLGRRWTPWVPSRWTGVISPTSIGKQETWRFGTSKGKRTAYSPPRDHGRVR